MDLATVKCYVKATWYVKSAAENFKEDPRDTAINDRRLPPVVVLLLQTWRMSKVVRPILSLTRFD